jgi:hypothetical protein
MSTKRSGVVTGIITNIHRAYGRNWVPKSGNPNAASAALAITVALLRALRDRGLLTEGEIDDLFGEAAERLHGADALNLLHLVRSDVEHKDEE